MNWNDLNLIPAMPEIVLLSALGIVLLADLWISDKNRYITHILSLLALVATAAGLFVAIPAVLAYNALVRSNKTLAQDMDSFAHDLHVQLLNQKD